MHMIRYAKILAVAGLVAAGFFVGISVPAIAQPHQKAVTAATITPTPAPAYCGHKSPDGTFGIRAYTATPDPADVFIRSGAHGHGGLLRCITFYVGDAKGALYVKTIMFDPTTGGLLIPYNGVDVTYVNCALGNMRYPPPPYTGTNDCAESWGTSEDNWVFYDTTKPMIPSSTP